MAKIEYLRCEWCFTFLTPVFASVSKQLKIQTTTLECKGCKRKFKIKTK